MVAYLSQKSMSPGASKCIDAKAIILDMLFYVKFITAFSFVLNGWFIVN